MNSDNNKDIFEDVREKDFDVSSEEIASDSKPKSRKIYIILIFIFGFFTIVQMNLKEANVNNMIITDIGNSLKQTASEFVEPTLDEIQLRNGNQVSSGNDYLSNSVESVEATDYDFLTVIGDINTEVDFVLSRLDRIIFINNSIEDKDRFGVLRIMAEMQANAENFTSSFDTVKSNVIKIANSKLLDKSTSVEFIRFVNDLEEVSFTLFNLEGERLIYKLGELGDPEAAKSVPTFDALAYENKRALIKTDLLNIKNDYSYITDIMLEQLL